MKTKENSKKTMMYRVTLLCLLVCCQCFDVISQEIYVTGSFSGGGYLRAAVYHNNTRLHEPIGDGKSIAVDENNNIYVAGSKWITSAYKAMVWKNGVELYNLTNDNGNINRKGSANSIVINGNDVWVTGFEQNNSNKKVAKVWKNGIQQYILSNENYDAEAISVFISQDVVYASGYETNGSSTRIAKVWKNNSSWYELSTRNSYARSIIVLNDNIYVAGEVDKPSTLNISDIKVWLNGNELYTLNQTDLYGRGRSMVILDNDIYVTGYEKSSGSPNTQFSRVWKNGNVLYTLSSATNEDGPYSIFVKKQIIPVTNIIGVPTSITVGTPISLVATVEPSNATNQNIDWSISNAGTTGAYITGTNTLNTTNSGTLIVTATIIDGTGTGTNYTKNFNIIVNSGVGITKITQDDTNIKIYPNPASNSFFIDCENISTIKLYDILGKEILSQKAKGKTEINIEHLPKGIYSVRILLGGKIIKNSKIVKQ